MLCGTEICQEFTDMLNLAANVANMKDEEYWHMVIVVTHFWTKFLTKYHFPIWKQNLGTLTGLPPIASIRNVTVSRSTPTVAGDLLIVGIYGPAVVIAVTRLTAQLVWMSQLDPRPLAQITASGTFYLGAFYVGVSSLEELLPREQCCMFRGSMVKLDVRNGVILWQTYTIPDNGGKLGGYSGRAIWESSPAIDIIRQLVYVRTGNLYIVPPDVLECQRWSTRLSGYDIFNFECLTPNNTDCPPGPNADADFGEAPMLLTIVNNGRFRDVAVAVQKSGFAWLLIAIMVA
ncbi:hypothetical protein ACH5RR_035812 [Cinchona calisaya]|uniref:Bulb-type lectin domain-containing protein n=1 Tax=Cinchona calisaya TaxID=153742 RepID=A0ABD2Y6U9_9GENT